MADAVDRRVLGALRPSDGVTGARIVRPLHVVGAGLTIARNRAGLYVIYGARGLEAHVGAFPAPPPTPPTGSLGFTVVLDDPRGEYLPVAANLTLPRAIAPGTADDLMTPIEVAMASSAARAAPLSWAVLRAIVRDTTDAPVRGALVEARAPGGDRLLGWGVTNSHGETLVAVPDLPSLVPVETDPGDDDGDAGPAALATAETAAEVSAVADPARPWPANPMVLAARGAGLAQSAVAAVALSPGRTDTAALTVDLT